MGSVNRSKNKKVDKLGRKLGTDYILLSEAAKECRYSQEYLSLRARQGKLKSIKKGRNWLTTKEWLREYLDYCENLSNKHKKWRLPDEIIEPAPPPAIKEGIQGEDLGAKKPEIYQDFWILLLNGAKRAKLWLGFLVSQLGLLIKSWTSQLFENIKLAASDISDLLRFIRVSFDEGQIRVPIESILAGIVTILTVFGLLAVTRPDVQAVIGYGLEKAAHEDIAFANLVSNNTIALAHQTSQWAIGEYKNLPANTKRWLLAMENFDLNNFLVNSTNNGIASLGNFYKNNQLILEKLNEVLPQKFANVGNLAFIGFDNIEALPKRLIDYSSSFGRQNLELISLATKNAIYNFRQGAEEKLNDSFAVFIQLPRLAYDNVYKVPFKIQHLSFGMQTSLIDARDKIVNFYAALPDVASTLSEIGSRLFDNSKKLAVLFGDWLFGKEPAPSSLTINHPSLPSSPPQSPTSPQTPAPSSTNHITQITTYKEVVKTADYQKDLNALEERLLLQLSDTKTYLLSQIMPLVTTEHTYIWAPAERINALADIQIDGMTVRSGSVLFSTNGTIIQSGNGEVSFNGNVNANNGLDVSGNNLTVGGNNFFVDNSGNVTALGTSTLAGLVVTGSATSTFANGIEISAGCFRLPDGSCAGSGGGLAIGNLVAGGTNGSVLFIDAGSLAQDNSNFFWDNSSKILGLGTTTPNWNLEISGSRPSLALSDYYSAATPNHWLFSSMGGNLYVGTSTGSYGTSTPAALTILNNGNVGIGTSSPVSTLSVAGNAYFNNLIVPGTTRFNNNTYTWPANIVAGNYLQTDSGGNLTWVAAGGGSGGDTNWTFVNLNGGFIRLASTSNAVGIGTSSPYAKLSVTSTAIGSTTLALVPIASQTANIIDIYDTLGNLNSVFTASGSLGIGTTSPLTKLSVQGTVGANDVLNIASSTGASLLYVNAAGNVGIGTAAPSSRLHILNTLSQMLKLERQNVGLWSAVITSNPVSQGDTLNTGSLTFVNSTYTGDFAIRANTSGEVNFVVKSGGNVGIGTTSPNWLLQVSGTRPSLALSDYYSAATPNIWLLSSMGGNFYLGTSTGSYATSTPAALTILNNGNIGISTSSPGTLLSIGGVANFTNSTSTFYGTSGGLSIASGCFAIGTQCVGTGTLNGTGISNSLAYWTNGSNLSASTTLTYLAATSRVGIGTSTPNWDLQIASTSRPFLTLTDYSAPTNYKHWFLSSQGGSFFIGTSSDTLNSTSTYFTIAPGGNVGIGTTTPNSKLTIFASGSTAAASPAITFQASSTSAMWNSYWTMGSDLNDAGKFKISSSTALGTNDVLTIDGQGYVLIGTSTASSFTSKLAIRSPGPGSTAFLIRNSLASEKAIFSIVESSSGSGMLSLKDYTETIKVSINANGSNNYFAVGNLGIGTTSPYARLTVWSGGTSTGQAFQVVNNASSSLFTILDNGNVGIGTTSPYSLLAVTGQVVANYFSATSTTATSTLPYLSVTTQSNVGTVVGGTWQGTAVTPLYGGTGLNTIASGSIIYGQPNNTYIALASSTPGSLLMLNWDSAAPSWQATSSLGLLGSTTVSSLTNNYLPKWNSTGVFNNSLLYDSGINVGIGTSTPSDLLDINGNIGIENQNSLRFYELRINGNQYFALTATSSMAVNVTLTLPDTGGASGQALLSNGNGNLYWGSASASLSIGSAIGSATPGSVLFVDASSLLAQDNTNFFWDYTNHRLGLGTTSPSSRLTVWGGSTDSATAFNVVNSASSTLFTVLNNGYVGIGTSSPLVAFQIGTASSTQITNLSNSAMVSGDLEVAGNAFLGPMEFPTDSGVVSWVDMPISTSVATGTSESYTARLGGTNILTIFGRASGYQGGISTSTAGIGIGTTSPLSVLDIFKANGNAAIGLTASSTQGIIYPWTIGVDLNDQGKFKISSSTVLGTNDRLVIDGSGRVGVGTSSPQAQLEIVKTSSGATADQLYISNLDSATSTASRLTFRTSDLVNAAGTTTASISGMLFQNYGAGNGNLIFSTLQSGSLTEAMRINHGGRVGIGTTTPNWLLQVSGTRPSLALSDYYSAATPNIWLLSSIGGNFYLGTSTGSYATSTPAALTILNNGNIGISTSSPGTLFSIGGVANFTNSTSTFYGASGGISIASGCFAIGTNCIGGSGFTGTGLTNSLAYWTSGSNLSASTTLTYLAATGRTGIGTSTPNWDLQIASTSRPFLTLTDFSAPANYKHWFISSQGGSFFIGTSSDTLNSTSTYFAIAPGGNIGIGTTTPSQKLTLSQGGFLQTAGIPVLATSSDTGGAYTDSVYVSGKYAYVGANSATASFKDFQIYDISNPNATSTLFVSSVDPGGNTTYSIYVSGKYAYIGTDATNDFQIYDISNPATPVLVSSVDAGTTYTYAVYVSGKYAYIGTDATNDFQIYDISNPASPTLVSSTDTGGNYTKAIYVSGKYAYIGTDLANDFMIYDISNPTSPSLVSSTDTGGAYTYSIYVSGKFAYVGAYSATASFRDFQIYNISNPASPTLVSSVDPGGTYTYSVYVSGKYAYIGTNATNDFQIYDVSSPTVTPTLVSSVDPGANYTYSVFVSGKYAYLGTDVANDFMIYSISGIDSPAATIGTLAAGTMNIWENADIKNNLNVDGGLNVGPGGIFSGGPISVYLASSTDANEVSGYFAGKVGIGTTTPNWLFQVSGTRPSLALSDYYSAATSNIWLLSSMGGNFYLGTSTGTYATSTPAALTILNNGSVGIGTSSPWANLSINQNAGQTALVVGSSTTSFVVDSSGRVGIGTAAPGYALQISTNADTKIYINDGSDASKAGLIQFTNGGAGSGYVGINSSSGTGLGATAAYGMVLGTNSTRILSLITNNIVRMTFDTAGLVGIGTTTPNWLFQISGARPSLALSDYYSAATSNIWLLSSMGGNFYLGTSTGTYATSTPAALTILNNGNIGISTSSPGTLFSIGGVANFTNSTSTFYGTSGGISIASGCFAIGTACVGGSGFTGTGITNSLAYWTSGSSLSASTTLTYLAATSRVGIGTSTPNWDLQIASTSRPFLALSDMSAPANYKHWFISSQGGSFFIGTSSDTLNSTSTYFAIAPGGNVGIGTTSPTAKLTLQGANSVASTTGLELVTNGTFDLNLNNWTYVSGWSWDASGKALRSGDNYIYDDIYQPISLTAGQKYQIQFTLSGNNMATMISVNGLMISLLTSDGTFTYGFVATTTASQNLKFSSLGYTGHYPLLDNVSVKQITVTANALANLLNSDGSAGLEMRSGGSGLSNTYIGLSAGLYNITGYSNVGVGSSALYSNISGYQNTAVGNYALISNSSGYANSALGNSALYANTIGYSNSALGSTALYTNTTGFYNSALGSTALYTNTTGSSNSALGYGALYANTTGSSNSALGVGALYANTTGSANSALGDYALYANTTGSNNLGIGSSALNFNQTGSANTAIGTNAGYGSNTYSFASSTFLGYNAGYALTTGNSNILLGYQAGDVLTTGSNNIILGYDIDAPAVDSSNILNIGNLLFGTGINGTGTTLSTGNIGIGTTSPYAKLTVWGGASAATTAFNVVNSASSTLFTVLNNGNVAIGTTTPNWLFQITGTRPSIALSDYVSASTPNIWLLSSMGGNFYLGTSTGSYATSTPAALTILNNGNIGISTSSPGTLFSIGGVANFTNSTSTFYGASGGISIASGCFAIGTNCIGGTSLSGGLNNSLAYWTSGSTLSASTTLTYLAATSRVGIGTSTPNWDLQIASTSRPFLTLTDYSAPANYKHWFISSQGGSFFIGTSSDTLNSTSTYFAIAPGGNVGIGTTSPYSLLAVTGQVVANYFTATSTTATSTFPYLSVTTQSNVGTVVGGTWQATAVTPLYGGTGLNTIASGSIIYGQPNNTYATLASSTPGSILMLNWNSAAPSWQATSSLGLLGSTTVSSLTNNYLPKWNSTGVFNNSLLYDTGINLSIGTTTPNWLFQISGTRPSLALSDYYSAATPNIWLLSSQGGSFYISTSTGSYATSTPNPILTINNNGNFGLSTTTPGAKFSIAGVAGATSPMFLVSTSSALYATNTAFIISSNGRVGIGTSSPQAQLEIVKTSSGATADQLYISNLDSATSTASRLTFRTSDLVNAAGTTTASISGMLFQNYGAGNGNLIFSTLQSGSLTEAMRINHGGRVGIGTTTPNWLFQITGTRPSLALSDYYSAATPNIWLLSSMGGNLYVGTSTGSYGTSTPAALTILNNGYVGIGTSSPVSTLSVAGNAYFNNLIVPGTTRFNNNTYTWPANIVAGNYLQTDSGGNLTWVAASSGSGGDTNWTFVNLNGGFIRLASTSNAVGIGTSSPYAKLSVTSTAIGSTTLALVPIASQTANIIDIYDTLGNLNSVFTASGSLGIGTTSPLTKLSVQGTVGANDVLNIASSTGASLLYVNAAGNVGIGTANPIDKLSIATVNPESGILAGAAQLAVYGNGAAYIAGRDTANHIEFGFGTSVSGSTFAGSMTNHPFALRVNNSNKLFIDTSGNIGIGTTTPNWLLQVSGTRPSLTLSDYYSAATPNIWLLSSMGGNFYLGTSTGSYGTSTPAALTILNNGNIGINTSSPGTLFSIGGVANFTNSTSTFYGSSGGISIASGCFAIGTACVGGGGGSLTGSGNTNQLAYWSSASNLSSSSTLTYLAATGRVGIGTSTPNWDLQIASTSRPFLTLTDYSAPTNYKHWFLSSQGGNFYVGTSSDALNATTTYLTINSGGNVGIGTTSPLSNLAVSGGMSVGANYNIASPSNGMIIQGNVGIGTTSPSQALSVSGSGLFSNGLGISSAAPVINRGINYSSINQAGSHFGIYNTMDTGTAGDAYGVDNSLTIDTASRFGYGVYNSITVSGDSAYGYGEENSLFSANDAFSQMVVGSHTSLITYSGDLGYGYYVQSASAANQAGTQYGFYADMTSGTATKYPAVLLGGNVGIGTSSPNWALQVTGTRPSLALSDYYSAATPNIWLLSSMGGNFYLGTSTGSYATSTPAALTILNNGNIGIGTSSPGTLLSIGGVANFTNSTSTFYGASGGISIASGCFAIGTNCIGGGTSLSGGITNSLAYWTSSSGLSASSTLTYIAATSRVGIGTSTPNWDLQIASTSKPFFVLSDMSAAVDAKHWFMSSQGGNLYIGTSSDALNATSTYLAITNGGNLVIGTPANGQNITNPIEILESNPSKGISIRRNSGNYGELDLTPNGISIYPEAAGTPFLVKNTINDNSVFQIDTVAGTSKNSTTTVSGSLIVGATANTPGIFQVMNSTSYPIFRINPSVSGGNVGIGTSSPQAPLEIVKTSSGATADQLYISNLDSATSTASRLTFRTSDLVNAAGTTTASISGMLFQNYGAGNGNLIFSTLQSGSLTEAMRINHGGRVGIGTTTPNWLLQVSGTRPSLALSDYYSAATPNIWLLSSMGGNLYISSSTGSYATSTPTSALTILSNGNVGISTSTPGGQLSVAGLAGESIPMFLVSTSSVLYGTNTAFIIDANGKVGINTSSPGTLLSIGGVANFTNSTSTFYGASGGISIASGCFAIGTQCVGGGGGSLTGSGNANQLAYWTSGSNLSASSTLTYLAATSRVGIGTSTPNWDLQIASTSRPFLTLTDYSAPTNGKHWFLSSQGGNFYVGTSSDTLDATSTHLVIETSVSGKTSLGAWAGNYITGVANTFVGYQAGYGSSTVASTGFSNTALGYQTFYSNTTGSYNSALGMNALSSNTIGNSNSALGYSALASNTTGYYNSALGYGALDFNTTGNSNLGIGYQALFYNQTGSANTVIGTNAGRSSYGNSFASSTLFGYNAGYALTTGNSNILLGYQAGDALTTGSNNIILGYDIDAPAINSSNILNIGNLLFGTGINGTGTTLSTGNIGIGTSSPNWALQVTGTRPSLALSDYYSAATPNIWLLSSMGGNFYLGTSTGSYATSTPAALTILNNGNIGVGTSSPGTLLSIGGVANFTNSTSTFYGTSGGISIASGCFAIGTACVGGSGFTGTGITNSLAYWTSGSSLSASTTLTYLAATSRVGIGTSTPNWDLQIASTSRPFLTLTDYSAPTNYKHWFLSSQGGSLYIGTSSDALSATSTYLVIAPGGNVGIGTTSPLTKLSVQGTAGANNVLNIASSTGASMLYVNAAGNVGIGTMNPAGKVQIAKDSGNNELVIGDDLTSASLTYTQVIIGNSSDSSNIRMGQSNTAYTSFHWSYNATPSSAYEAITTIGTNTLLLQYPSANPNGNVGIGVISASYKLDVAGALSSANYPFNADLIDTASAAKDVGGGLGLGGSFTGTTGAIFAGIRGQKENVTDNDYAGYMSFLTRINGGFPTEKMRISSAGLVGIGTTSPAWNLQVSGARPSLALSDYYSAATPNIWLFSSQGGNLYIGTSTGSYGTSTPAALTILNNGNIGISTSSPGTLLSIGGVANFTNSTSTFYGASGGISIASGCFAIGTQCVGGGGGSLTGSGNANQLAYWTSGSNLSASTTLTYLAATGRTGIGTSTPNWDLQIASTSRPFLTLTDFSAPANYKHWFISSQGGSFFIGTSSDTLNSTSTYFAIAPGGNIGIGTTTPSQKLTLSQGGFLQTAGIPVLATSSDTGGAYTDSVYVSGKYAYVGANSATASFKDFQIYDISNPNATSTLFVSSVDPGGNTTYSIYVSGKYAYIGTDATNDFQIYDISNPATPVLVSSVDAGTTYTYAVYVSGKYAYIGTDATNDFQIYDISNPASPTLVSSTDTGGNYTKAIYVSGKYAYIGTDLANDFMIYDISNPTSPSLVSSTDTGGAYTYSIYVSGKFAYVGAYSATASFRDFQIYNISNPASPTLVSSVDPGGTYTYSVYVSGKYAYIGTNATNDFQIYDVSSPTVTPTLVSSVDPGANYTYSVFVSGKYAYLGTDVANDFMIYSISGIDSPAATIGTLAAGTMNIWENADIKNNLNVDGGLNVGPGGIFSGGPISVYLASSTDANEVSGYFAGKVGIGTTTPSEFFDVNGSIGIENQNGLRFYELRTNSNQYFALTATSSMASNVTLTLPDTGGTNGQALLSNGNGNLYWGAPAASLSVGSSIGGSTPGSVLFAGASNDLQQDNGNLFWNITNHRLGIGTSSPNWALQVTGATPSIALSDYYSAATPNLWLLSSEGGNFYISSSTGTYATSTPVSALTILSNGNIGVSTNTPGAQFSIAGLAGDPYPMFMVSTSSALFGTNTVFIISSNGKVGIGTTTPYVPLTIFGSNSNGSMGFSASTSAGASVPSFSIWTIGTDLNDLGKFKISSSTALGTNDRLTIDSSGRVGIGTSTPNWAFQISGSRPSLVLSDYVSAATPNFWALSSEGGSFYISTSTGGYATSTPNPILTISNGGNVGLSTTSPGAKFSIAGVAGATSPMFLVSTSSALYGTNTAFIINSNGRVGVGTTSPGAKFAIAGASGDANPMFMVSTSSALFGTNTVFMIDASGNIGIGTSSPGKNRTFGQKIVLSGNSATATTSLIIARGSICVDNDGGCVATSSGYVNARFLAAGASDVAEQYNSDELLKPADIVMLKANRLIGKATKDSRESLLGVVSGQPGLALGSTYELDGQAAIANQYPVALSGRVLVKVSTEGGEIGLGDKITISSLDGIGMKAVNSGKIVGTTLEAFDSASATQTAIVNGQEVKIGEVLMFVNLGYARSKLSLVNPMSTDVVSPTLTQFIMIISALPLLR